MKRSHLSIALLVSFVAFAGAKAHAADTCQATFEISVDPAVEAPSKASPVAYAEGVKLELSFGPSVADLSTFSAKLKSRFTKWAPTEKEFDSKTTGAFYAPVRANLETYSKSSKSLSDLLQNQGRQNELKELQLVNRTLTALLQQYETRPTHLNLMTLAHASAAAHSFLLSVSKHYERSNAVDDRKARATLSILQDLRSSQEQSERRINHARMRSKLFVPTNADLSIFDFNYLVGTGIAPVGLITENMKADGVDFDPLSFFTHDQGHALYNMVSRMSSSQRGKWLRILTSVDALPNRQRAIVHALIFYITHEVAYPMNAALFRPNLVAKEIEANLYTMHERLHDEEGFGIPELSKNLVEFDELKEVAAIYVNIVAKAK